MSNYKWLLFDADHTLFDFDAAAANALRNTFATFGYEFLPEYEAVYQTINTQIWKAFERGEISSKRLRIERFERLFDALNLVADAAKLSIRYGQLLGEGTQLLDGAEALLAWLNGRYQLALITNGLKDVQRPRLAHSTIGHYFNPVIISDEVGVAKPNGRIFDIAFAQMGNPPKNDVLMIGDSLTSDMAGGIGYGIDTCWFNPAQKPRPTEMPITYEIHTLSQLQTILAEGQRKAISIAPQHPISSAKKES